MAEIARNAEDQDFWLEEQYPVSPTDSVQHPATSAAWTIHKKRGKYLAEENFIIVRKVFIAGAHVTK